jgi:ferredoxin
MTLRVEAGSCCGFGNCALVAPMIFRVDPVSNRAQVLLRYLGPETLSFAQRAADECPTQAIELIRG